MNTDLFVVIPLYNEENWIGKTLISLASQTDLDYKLILVNNNSTDNSHILITNFLECNPQLNAEIIFEKEKGTGSAADTGFKYSISKGAKYIARTDADCIVDKNWIKNIKKRFYESNVDFIIGRSGFRTDEPFNLFSNPFCLWWGIRTAELHGFIFRRGKEFQYNFKLAPGHNIALTSDLYNKCGGFPRKSIEEVHDDVYISENIRKILSKNKVIRDKKIFIQQSNRRYNRNGIFNTLNWYRNHSYVPDEVDIR